MLKSYSTQLAATAFFGPLGLAYTSMATAVLFTLTLAVLYFTVVGALAIVVFWPISIVTGVLYVKLNNDRFRQSGNSLLLGPGQDVALVDAVSGWARGVAVLAVVCGVGYLAFVVLPGGDDVTAPGVIVPNVSSDSERNSGQTGAATGDNNIVRSQTESVSEQLRSEQSPSEQSSSEQAGGSPGSTAPVITLPSRDIPTVVVDPDGNSTQSTQTLAGESGAGRSVLYVDREVVNLRQGPGTNYAIVVQLDRNEELVEFARDGQWINVETRSGRFAGWIFGELVRR